MSVRDNKHLQDTSLGQHWLHDENFLNQIADFADIEPSDAVVEVGPGLGTLTQKLLLKTSKLTAVEFDGRLADDLAEKFPDVQVVKADIRSFDFSKCPQGYKVVANIPYYLTSHLIRILLQHKSKPSLIVFLIQKEVAERIAAAPGDMSILSVMAQFYTKVTLGSIVPAHHFSPPPKVDSRVIRLVIKEEAELPDVNHDKFFRVVKAGFSNRRKKLINAMAGGLAMPKTYIADVIARCGFSEDVRAQELSIDDWLAIYSIISDKLELQN